MATVCFDNIPDKSLALIFSFYARSNGHKKLMDVVANVCQRWREIASMTPEVWSDVEVCEETETSVEDLREFAAKGLLSYTRSLLVIDQCIDLKRDVFKAIIGRCPRLLKLDVYGLELGIDASDIAESCRLLEKLYLRNRCPTAVYRCKFNIQKFHEGCPRLKELYLRNIRLEYDDDGEKGFELLESLTCIDDLTVKELLLIAGKSPKLNHLSVWNSSLNGLLQLPSSVVESFEFMTVDDYVIPDAVFTDVLQKWKHSLRRLMVICLDFNGFDIGQALRSLVDGNPDLQIKSVKIDNVMLKLQDLIFFVECADKLEYLDVEGVRGLPEEYRQEYSSVGAVQRLRLSLLEKTEKSTP